MEAQFLFTQVPQAFQKLEEGHARGKTVVRVTDEDGRAKRWPSLSENSSRRRNSSDSRVRGGGGRSQMVKWTGANECIETFSVLS